MNDGLKSRTGDERVTWDRKLKNCPACGQVVSRTAAHCPQCGHKIKGLGPVDIIIKAIIIVFFVPLFLYAGIVIGMTCVGQ